MCESGTYQLITPSPFPETYIDLQSPNSSVQHSTAPMISLIFSPISVPSSLLTGLSLNHLLLLFQLLIFVCIHSLPRILFFFPFVCSITSFKDKFKSYLFKVFCFFVFFFAFSGPHPWHMQVPRLGVESELQLQAYTTAMAMPDPSHIYDLHKAHSNTRSLTHQARPGNKPTSL